MKSLIYSYLSLRLSMTKDRKTKRTIAKAVRQSNDLATAQSKIVNLGLSGKL